MSESITDNHDRNSTEKVVQGCPRPLPCVMDDGVGLGSTSYPLIPGL